MLDENQVEIGNIPERLTSAREKLTIIQERHEVARGIDRIFFFMFCIVYGIIILDYWIS